MQTAVTLFCGDHVFDRPQNIHLICYGRITHMKKNSLIIRLLLVSYAIVATYAAVVHIGFQMG